MHEIIDGWRSFLAEGVKVSFDIGQHLAPTELEAIKAWAGFSGEAKHLGTATMGSAYQFGDKVLKITKDSSEANAAATLIGEEHPNVYKIYAVGKLPGRSQWVIISELLMPSDKEMHFAAKEMYNKRNIKKDYYNWGGVEETSPREQKILSALTSFAPAGFDKEQIKQYVDQIATGLTYLASKGITFTDIKPSNIMNKDGRAAIIDVGRAGVKEYVDIPEISLDIL